MLSRKSRGRQRPAGVVSIVVGRRPYLDDRADLVVILPGDKPARLDWRPIVGLPVALFTADGHEALGAETVDALQAVDAKLVG